MNNLWKPTGSLETLRQRAFLLSEIRKYFLRQDVLEVETPILSAFANTDINIESFSSDMINSFSDQSFLRTSPEFPLKRLLSAGYGDVFEIAKVFRKGEVSSCHNMEFTMLEWYRVNFSYLELMEDIAELYNSINTAFKKKTLSIQISTFSECFSDHLELSIEDMSLEELNACCQSFCYSGSSLNRDQCLDYLFASEIQPQLGKDCIQFVSHYPASQAALAELDPATPQYALRFEFFINGMEFGNGYQELTDAQGLQQRFEKDNQIRQQRGDLSLPMDELLLQAMDSGMPKCSGVAVGIERWLMYLLNKSSIGEVMSFSTFNS